MRHTRRLFKNLERFSKALILTLFLSLATSAEEWLLLWREGEKPNRSVFYIATDIRNVLTAEEEIATVVNSRTQKEMDKAAESAKTVRVQVLQVFESPNGPYATTYWADFRARDTACRLEKGTHWYRDDRIAEDFSAPKWQPVPSNWQRRAFDMAIHEKPWREALTRLREKERASGQPVAQDELINLGTLSVGRHILPNQLADLTWQTFWTDGTRPPWEFTKRSAEQVERDRREVLDYLEWAIGELSRMESGASRDLQQLEAERREEERRAEARQRRPHSSLNKELESWIGVPEHELILRNGEPTSFREEGGTRILIYSSSQVVPLNQSVLSSNGRDWTTQVVGENTLWRDITYFIVNGRVYDFVVEGNEPNL